MNFCLPDPSLSDRLYTSKDNYKIESGNEPCGFHEVTSIPVGSIMIWVGGTHLVQAPINRDHSYPGPVNMRPPIDIHHNIQLHNNYYMVYH